MTKSIKTYKASWCERTPNRKWSESAWLESCEDTMDDAIENLITSFAEDTEIIVRSPVRESQKNQISWLKYFKIVGGIVVSKVTLGPLTNQNSMARLTVVYNGILNGEELDALIVKNKFL